LHFGLLSLPTTGSNARAFGGVGLMIEQPGLRLRVQPAKEWTAQGPCAERALTFARTFRSATPELATSSNAFAFTVESSPPEHVGLGAGTQLGLCVAKAIAIASGLKLDVAELAKRVGRGARSGLGVHGFAQGGLVVDGGKGPHTQLAPLVTRAAFPTDWRVVLVIPKDRQGLHGAAERSVFAEQTDAGNRQTDALCRLVLLEMLPALAERDLPAFGASLYEFNRRVGEMFRPWQGGLYAHPQTTALVEHIRQQGISAVGQSSWGPTVFAITDVERAAHLAQELRGHQADDVCIAAAANHGAIVEIT